MNHADLVKDTTATTGTGAITLAGTPAAGYQGLSALGGTGATFGYRLSLGAEWETGKGTITGTNTFSRSPTASSNSGSLVNFSAGTKEFICTVTADELSKMLTSDTLAFATAIPLTAVGNRFMPATAITGALTFTAAASPVQGALVYLPLVADGTNEPDFTAFREWGGSLGFDNTTGIENQVQFFYDGRFAWYSVSQQVGAVAADVIAPTASSAAVANAAPTYVDITMSEAIDPAYIPAASTVTVSGHAVSTLTRPSSTVLRATVSAAVVNGETPTAAYTANGTNDLRDLAGNLLANFTGLSITNSVGVAATGGTMTGPSGGAVSVESTAFSVGVTPLGSNITGTVTWTPSDGGGGGTFTPTTVTTNNGDPSNDFTYTPSSTAGARTISITNNGGLTNPSNITYTSTSAAALRLGSLASATESGSSPNWVYTGTGANYGATAIGGLSNLGRPSSTNASMAITIDSFGSGASGEPMLGVTTGSTLVPYASLDYCFYAKAAGAVYNAFTAGSTQTTTNTVTRAVGDIMRLRFVGTELVAEVAAAATPTVFTEVTRWYAVPTSAFKFQATPSQTSVISTLTGVGLA